METRDLIIEDYAHGIARGFLNDLAAGHIPEPTGENGLINAFISYVAKHA